MSRIDHLIDVHCAGGVEFLPIGDVVHRAPNLKWDERQGEQFQYIDLSSVDRATNRIVETTWIDRESAPSRARQEIRAGDVLFGTTRPMLKRYCMVGDDYDGQVASTGFCVLRPTERITSAWLYHLLGTPDFYDYVETNQRGASYPAISDSLVKKFKIPVPPLAIQREIASILDKMENLKAELEAELELRSRQYSFYRDQLMTFPETGGVRWVPMGEAGTFFRGKRFTKSDYVEGGIPCIHYGEIYTEFGPSTDKVVSHLQVDLRARLRFAEPGDVVIVDVGETVADVGKAVAWMGNGPVAIHDHCYAFRHGMNPAFVSHYMQTTRFHKEKARHVARTKVKTLLMDGLARVEIPVPSREDQDRIVAILDKFDALVNDLSIGLPAEIEARRKQYEYYRDKLLTFEESPAA